MSRVDVVPAEKGKSKVLVNMGMDGSYTYGSVSVANQEAKKIHAKMRNAELHLAKED